MSTAFDPAPILSIDRMSYDRETLQLTAELSDFDLKTAPQRLFVQGHHRVVQFCLVDIDRSPCGEDIAGFRYYSSAGHYRLLLIND